MTHLFKKTASLFLLMVFILPSGVKFGHQNHEHFECSAKHEKHFHELHEKCTICSFEFSTFSSHTVEYSVPKEQHIDKYSSHYKSINHSTQLKTLFSLRAPPILLF